MNVRRLQDGEVTLEMQGEFKWNTVNTECSEQRGDMD